MEIKNIFKIIFLKFFENSTKILIQLSSYRFHTNTITEKRIATITTATITIMRSRFLLWARSSWLETSASFEWESCESKIRFWTIILTLKMNWIIGVNLYILFLYINTLISILNLHLVILNRLVFIIVKLYSGLSSFSYAVYSTLVQVSGPSHEQFRNIVGGDFSFLEHRPYIKMILDRLYQNLR